MKNVMTLVALAGQPNCGKSTLFNSLTGASQHVANYPGVTVEKMSGAYRYEGMKTEVVDLPGTYSLTSYSLEERVSRDFLLHDKPSVVVNVVDASNLKRNLYLTFQLLEMEIPVILNLNMMDVARRRGIDIDTNELSRRLGALVVPTTIKTGKGKNDLLKSIQSASRPEQNYEPLRIDYGSMEPFLSRVQEMLSESGDPSYPLRWLSVKLMEGDAEARKLIEKQLSNANELLEFVEKQRGNFESQNEEKSERHIAFSRYLAADTISKYCVRTVTGTTVPLSDKVDRVLCNRYLGPVILLGVIWLLYELSIVQGYKLTSYTWPFLAKLRELTAFIMPDPGFVWEPLIRSFSLWFVDSINALLNYIPIFFILFGLIAILEDIGYMPRMAFILDRLFRRFGLHGQSTLPMVLGGVFVGGCAVPGIMSTKGIPDERARFATILIIPMLNCLAKTPLYILMINNYFPEHKGMAMIFIATITILMALPIAKILTITLLKGKETAPFIMEMPPYHLPTIRGVVGRAVERVWLYIKKIVTIVAAVAVILFVLLQFPGLNKERRAHYETMANTAGAAFYKKIKGKPYAAQIPEDKLMELVLYAGDYKNARMGVKKKEKAKAVDMKFAEKNPLFFKFIKPKKDKDARKVNRALKKLISARKKILREIKKEKIDNSYLGVMGRCIEPATQWAGFNWRVNVALLSAFAAKESSVATLGALYQQDEGSESLEKRMKEKEIGFTSLHALALMLFMALYPPCIAAAIMIKVQTGSVNWMFFSMIIPTILGLSVASLVFTGGTLLDLSGLQAMFIFYGLALTATIGTGLIKNKTDYM